MKQLDRLFVVVLTVLIVISAVMTDSCRKENERNKSMSETQKAAGLFKKLNMAPSNSRVITLSEFDSLAKESGFTDGDEALKEIVNEKLIDSYRIQSGGIRLSATRLNLDYKDEKFSCPGMKGFTFVYPLFENFGGPFTAKGEKPQECTVFFVDAVLDLPLSAPQMKVKQVVLASTAHVVAPKGSAKNSHQTYYTRLSSDEYEFFSTKAAFVVCVSLINIPNSGGFDRPVFW